MPLTSGLKHSFSRCTRLTVSKCSHQIGNLHSSFISAHPPAALKPPPHQPFFNRSPFNWKVHHEPPFPMPQPRPLHGYQMHYAYQSPNVIGFSSDFYGGDGATGKRQEWRWLAPMTIFSRYAVGHEWFGGWWRWRRWTKKITLMRPFPPG